MPVNVYKHLLYFLFLVFYSNCTHAQNYTWAKCLQGKGKSVPNNLSPGTSQCSGIVIDNNRNVYITGYCNDSVDFDPGDDTLFLIGGNDDIFFAKYDEEGNLIWAHAIKSKGWNYPTGIKLDNMNNLVITGYGNSEADFDPGTGVSLLSVAPGNANYFFIAKYDLSGNFIWAKSSGGKFGVQSKSLSLDPNNNICITGYFYDKLDMDPGPDTVNIISEGAYGVFFVKYDKDGKYVWANCLSDIGQFGRGSILECSEKGNIYITGFFGKTVDFNPDTGKFNITPSTTEDRFFAKYDHDGNFMWAKNIYVKDTTGWSIGNSNAMEIDKYENLILAGDFMGKIDVDPDSGQNFLLSYYMNSAFFCKYDSSGNLALAKCIRGYYCIVSDIALDSMQGMYLTGSFSKADFDPSSKVFQLISNAPSAFMNFFAKYDEKGNFIWAKMIGNNGYASGAISSVIAINTVNQFIGGGFKQSGDFDPDSNHVILTATGVGQNSFFAKYSIDKETGVMEENFDAGLFVFPNPFHQQTILFFNNPQNEKHTLSLYDLSGRMVKTWTNLRTDRVEINRKNLSKGLYFFQLSVENRKVAGGKLMVE